MDGTVSIPARGCLAVMAGFLRHGGEPRHQKLLRLRVEASARALPPRIWQRTIPPSVEPTSQVDPARRQALRQRVVMGTPAGGLLAGEDAADQASRGRPFHPRATKNTKNQEPPSRRRETRTNAHPRAPTTTTRPSNSGQRSSTGCKTTKGGACLMGSAMSRADTTENPGGAGGRLVRRRRAHVASYRRRMMGGNDRNEAPPSELPCAKSGRRQECGDSGEFNGNQE